MIQFYSSLTSAAKVDLPVSLLPFWTSKDPDFVLFEALKAFIDVIWKEILLIRAGARSQ